MDKIYYLDNNATTMSDQKVIDAMSPYFSGKYFNPSSIYTSAQEVRRDLEAAREEMAKFINADPKDVIFTSGGTESDNFAIKGIAYANTDKGRHIITSKIEHPAVLETCRYLEKNGWEVTYLNVDKFGLVSPGDVKAAIKKGTVLISVMYANNEIGTIEPIEEIGAIANDAEVYFHTDAVQAAGKIPIDVKRLRIDLLSLAAHKFHGPKGVGMIYIKKGVRIHSMIQGGHQERSKRPGTENIPGIIGMAKACAIATEHFNDLEGMAKIKNLRDSLEKGLLEKIPDIIINGHPEKRIDNTLNVCVRHIEGEAMLIHLDFEGICVSSGSACASGSLEPSHVLLALGLPHETAHGSIRFSFSKYSTEDDVNKVLEVMPGIVEKLRKMSPMWNERNKK